MKNLKVKSRLAIVALLLVSVSYVGMAQRMQGPPPQGERKGTPQLEERQKERGPKIPNLTEEQEAQLKALHLDMEKATLPIHNQIAEKEARLNTITTADEINLKDAGRVIQEISDLRTKLMTLKVENLVKMKEVLTDEQELALNHQLLRKPQEPGAKRPGFSRGR